MGWIPSYVQTYTDTNLPPPTADKQGLEGGVMGPGEKPSSIPTSTLAPNPEGLRFCFRFLGFRLYGLVFRGWIGFRRSDCLVWFLGFKFFFRVQIIGFRLILRVHIV